jgi:hypothetical protein
MVVAYIRIGGGALTGGIEAPTGFSIVVPRVSRK